MTTDRPKTISQSAMKGGTLMGIYWIVKFTFLPLGFTIPLLQLLFILLTVAVPVLGYLYVRGYRNRHFEKMTYLNGFSFSFFMYLYASMLAAVAHYVYFRYIDQGYFLNMYTEQLNLVKQQVTGNMLDSVNQLMETIDMISALSPFDITLQLFSQNIFHGILFSVITGWLVRKS